METNMPTEDHYRFYDAALAGSPPALVNGQVESGWWRLVGADRSMTAVATWVDEETGEKFVRIGTHAPDSLEDSEAEFFETVFTRCCKCPIPEDLYDSILTGAQPWPELPEELMAQFSNLPPEHLTLIANRAKQERELAEAWLQATGEISSKADCDRAAAWALRVSDLEKLGKAYYAEAKAPHEQRLAAVRQDWTPVLEDLDQLKRRLKSATLPFLDAEARRLQAELEASLQAGEPPPVERRAKAGVAGAGRRISVRVTKQAKIVDYQATLQFFATHKEVAELIQKLANRVAAAGAGPIPGVEIVDVKSVS
jgi:hypothetical protein